MDKSQYIKQIPEPALSRFLFADTRMSWLWLIIRLYVGYQWLMAGWDKVRDPLWVGSGAGTALHGYLATAFQKSYLPFPEVSGWYANFLQFVSAHAAAFSYLVAYGELLVGVALVLGFLTGIAAFFGSFMNMNYLLAGTVSTNPVLLVLGLFLILAWRTAGWLGLDQYALPALGVPWKPGHLWKTERA